MIKNKVKETNLERYGTTCSLLSKMLKKKIKTTLEKFGVEHNSQSEIVKQKKETNLENMVWNIHFYPKRFK